MNPASAQRDASTLTTACEECDLLLTVHASHRRPRCPRCGAVQASARAFKPTSAIALSLSGLILAIPAFVYPQMNFSLVGNPNTYTLLGGAKVLMDMGFYWVGALILLCTCIAPVALLILVMLTSLGWQLHLPTRWVRKGLKLYHHILPWVMLDVYLLAVAVSMIKLMDMGDFSLTRGFACFLGLLAVLALTTRQFNTDRFWDLTEQRDAGH